MSYASPYKSCALCSTGLHALGLCRRHYRALKKWGDPHGRPPTLEERVHSRYRVDAQSGCWIWTGQLNNKGYGLIHDNRAGGKVAAHRVLYEFIRGKVPAGLELDHLCARPACVNPDHLEPVTHRENILRGYARRRRAS